jgi:hypothetical protein
MMATEYRADATTALTIIASTTDNSVTIPENLPDSMLSNPLDSGSLYYVSVNGVAVAWNFNAPAVFPTTTGANNPILEVNPAMGKHPVNIPPGTVVHVITKTGNAIVSLTRARRMY